MLVRTESTRWRCCSMILVTLTPLMLSMGARIGSEQETFNAARNQPVVVEPARATCGFNNVDWVDTYSQGVAYCLHGCVRNVSTVSQRERIFPSGVVEMGGHRCRTKRIEARFMKSYKRRNVGERRTLCYILYENPYSESPGDYTYSVWIKPTDTQTEQSLIANNVFQIMIRDGYLEGVVYSTQQPAITKFTRIDPDIWTHVAIRVKQEFPQESGIMACKIAVFTNGVFLASVLKVYGDQGWQVRETERATTREGLYLGVQQVQIDSVGCEVLEIDACAAEGYSPAVSMPDGRTQRDVVFRDARRLFPTVFDSDHQPTECERTRNARLIAMFGCALLFPTCRRSGKVLPPCRSLCTAVMEDWCEDSRHPNITCDAFPDSMDSDVCVGLNYTPDFEYYKGSVRNGQLFWRLLTDRQIEAQYLGRLRRVRPLSECLCDATHTPALLANSSLTCVNDGLPSQISSGRLDGGRREQQFSYARRERFLPEFVNDGNMSTAWASSNNTDSTIAIQINFQSHVQLSVVKIHLASDFPRRGIVIMTNKSGDFRVIQNMSTNCQLSWGLDTDGTLQMPDSVNCQNLSRLAGGARTPPYTITIDLRRGRPRQYPVSSLLPQPTRGYPATTTTPPQGNRVTTIPPRSPRRRRDGQSGWTGGRIENGQPDETYSPAFQKFLSANAVRVIFEGTPLKGGRSHIVPEISVFPRNTCGCYSDGTYDGYQCLDGVCQCRDVPGVDIAKAGPKCRPYMTRMIPSFGPRSGGTKVVILGGFLGRENSSVSVRTWIEDIAFEVYYNNETRVYCLTPPMTGTRRDIMNVPTELKLTLESGHKLRTNTKFLYKEDPVVERIEPEKSFLTGGILQTIIGRHMDSVAVPVMNVTLVYRGSHYKQDPCTCTVVNSTVIYCPTPTIQLPSDFGNVITKRDLSYNTEVTQHDSNTGTGYGERVRRSAASKRQAGLLNSDDVQFYMGLLLDGVTTYRNISETLPQYGKLNMFTDPQVDSFAEEVLLFRPYSPYNDERVVIKGKHMTYGCSAEDYNISVGKGLCEVLDLQTNQLICRAPRTKPKLGLYHKHGAPMVTVEVGNIKVVVGYLRYEESLVTSAAFRNAIIAVVCVLVLLALAALLGVYVYRKRRKQAQHQSLPNVDFDVLQQRIGLNLGRPRDIIKALNPSLATKIEASKIESSRMKLGKIIGQGNFGEVYTGELLEKEDKSVSKQVAIKTVKDSESVRSVSEFLEEATIMHNFDHPNVLSLLGVVIDDNKPYVIMPLMENGDLRVFIGNRERSFSVRDLLGFGHQAAKGMAYLEDARFVHRDLAARNCMVDQKLTVKIADFGLARDIYTDDYYRVMDKYRPLPVKWMALEALKQSKFTSKSDVWSFGVVLWELMTRGSKPYSDIDNVDLRRYLEMGRRLDKPDMTPQCIYDLMMQCWLEDPEERLSFADICKVLNEVFSDDVDTESHDYVNDYLVLVDLAAERPSPKGYMPMSGGLVGQPLDTSTAERPSPKGYLPMSGQRNDELDGAMKSDDIHEKKQLLSDKTKAHVDV